MEDAAARSLPRQPDLPGAADAERLACLGLAAAGVAHDLSNLLTAVLTGCDLLAADLGTDPVSAAANLAQVRSAAERAAGLAGRMRSLARRQPEALETLDLNRAVANALPVVQQVAGPRVRVVASLARGDARVRLPRGALDQVLLNLAANARDAMPAGGTLKLVVRRAHGRGARPDTGDAWVLSAEDDGCGMPPGVAERAFQPLFTTKAQGSGLGLASVASIAAAAGGRAVLDSQPGRGTRVALTLPASA